MSKCKRCFPSPRFMGCFIDDGHGNAFAAAGPVPRRRSKMSFNWG